MVEKWPVTKVATADGSVRYQVGAGNTQQRFRTLAAAKAEAYRRDAKKRKVGWMKVKDL